MGDTVYRESTLTTGKTFQVSLIWSPSSLLCISIRYIGSDGSCLWWGHHSLSPGSARGLKGEELQPNIWMSTERKRTYFSTDSENLAGHTTLLSPSITSQTLTPIFLAVVLDTLCLWATPKHGRQHAPNPKRPFSYPIYNKCTERSS